MTKLISMIVAAMFAAVSVSALAADAPAKGDKMEKSDGKMAKKDDGKKAAAKKAAPKKAAPKMEEKK